MHLNDSFLNELQPDFTKDDLLALKAYFTFNEKYGEQISDQLRTHLLDNKLIGPIIRDQTPEEHRQRNKYSHQLQYDAIYEGKWQTFGEDLITQGIAYAQMGLQFSDWFHIVKIYRDYIEPYLLQEFPTDVKKAALVWHGSNKFIDHSLKIIAHSYFLEKNKIIRSEQDANKVALKKLKESEERLRAIYDNSSDRIFMIDEAGTIQFINHVAKGRTKDVVLGSNFFDYQSEKDRPRVKAILKKVFTTGKPATYESEVISKNDDIIFSGSVAPIFHDEKVESVAIIARDVTEQKKIEQQIRDLNNNLEQKVTERTAALQNEIEQRRKIEKKVSELNLELEKKLEQLHATNEELESFSYTVSHDLRAPLRAIDGFSKVLLKKLEGKLDTAQSHYLDVIIENVSKMGVLIDDLLAFSRMGRLEKKESKFDFKQLVNEVYMELMQSEDEDRVKLTLNALPAIKADREMMKHVMSNLLGNAVKFSSEKQISKIEVGSKKEKDQYIFYVKDNGVGFEMEYADKLFGIFQRLHSDDEFEGTGVGLAIVQRIIHRHEGSVWAQSELNKGATFYFSIPK